MFRAIKSSDKADVFKISSQIWDGDDYIYGVFDEWVKADDGLFTGYWVNNKLIGFGRMRFLTPSDIWLEALRKDPQTKIKGVGNKIAQYYIEQLKGKKIDSVRFSTYFGNITSIKLNEKLGFKKILTLSLKELKISNQQIKSINKAINNNISFNKLNQYILNSSYLKKTKNFISKGWVVYRYSNELLRTFYSAKQYAFYSENGEIKGAILISNTGYKDICWINYIDAENESIYKELINYAVSKALKDKCSRIQLLVPKIAKLMCFVNSYGFVSWEQENDFFLYEMPEHLIKQITGT